MDYLSLIGISVGLAMDAFAVSITNGTAYRRCRVTQALKIACAFGLFQALMPTIGWLAGTAFSSVISNVDHWVAFILLGIIGGHMIYEAVKGKEEEIDRSSCSDFLSNKTLLALAVATSIDALATGLILPSAVGASTPVLMVISVLTIGVITLIISFAGVFIGKKFGSIFSNKAEILGGIVLILIGIKILVDHLFLS